MPGNSNTVRKVSKYGVISGPYFPVLGLNTEKYFVSLCIQSECGKIRTRNNSVFGHFSRSESKKISGTYSLTLNRFQILSGVSIADFKRVNIVCLLTFLESQFSTFSSSSLYAVYSSSPLHEQIFNRRFLVRQDSNTAKAFECFSSARISSKRRYLL